MSRTRCCGVISAVCPVLLAALLAGCSSNNHKESSPDNGLDASCNPPDGGLPCDPSEVVCGSVTCSTPDEFCCISADAGPPACLDVSEKCPSPIAALYCDEAADCAPGLVCCGTVQNGVSIQFCGTSCSGPRTVQVCRTSAECPNAQPCVTQSCHGALFETCGPLQSGCEPG